MNTVIMILVVMTVIGLIFGLVLAYVNKRFAMEANPLVELVEDVLPKGQCGGCGFAGCKAYAEAVVLDESVPPNLCVPGKASVAEQVAKLTGKSAPPIEPRVAYVRCGGDCTKAVKSFEYEGIHDCVAANLLEGGPKACKYGCLGFGTCVKSCPFGAMAMGSNGLPIIDTDICTGCGTCVSACPKQVLGFRPVGSKVMVNCNSKNKGGVVRKACSVGCLGCGLCAKNCTNDAIKVENNLAVVDQSICASCSEATCLAKCPTGAIKAIVSGTDLQQQSKNEAAANS
ncbi:RnfABCDGE type electron transport complex subunit B [Clostridium sp. AWRP]|uniref:RnfABCDGE type electron transport complex subunit B n=1 Tax=Clostridium sp. AWRP TaxID=2212991 RepID=UPI000FDA3E89|nr:Fe-S cluster domain-containing protein [Clostridium sp. AWRP]AZV56141.1 Fe-S cluster domain-containing protein [Clostridium sp. AWRP]